MNDIEKLYHKLKREAQASHQWRVWGKRPKTKKEKERVMIEAILTQRANWRNVELAMQNLEQANAGSLKEIARLGNENREVLEELIRPSGFYASKAEYLKNLAEFVSRHGGVEKLQNQSKADLRKQLLELKGVGEETADDVLLYALEKPVFVIDEYTKRFAKRHNLTDTLLYRHLQELFEDAFAGVPDSEKVPIFQDFHAYIVMHGKELVKGNTN